MWFIGVEVEQEGVHPLLRKNPGSAPGPCYYFSPESKQSIPVKQPSLPPSPQTKYFVNLQWGYYFEHSVGAREPDPVTGK